jgi:hypothetical protein
MKVEARLFEIVTAFCFLVGIIYTVLTGEPVGVAGLFLTGGLCLIVGTYFQFVARRLETRPEDNPEAEVSDGAGDVGFFSPGSYWPIALAGSAGLLAISLAFFLVWAIAISVVILLLAVAGLVFEYHIRPADH